MSVELEPTIADLTEIAEQVWTSYLDAQGEHPLVPAEPEPLAADMSASVSITGSWHGHVVVACSIGAARHAAAAFLAMEPEEVSGEDIADVLGELANIVGGNVKSMLPAGCFVSLPQVVTAPGAERRYPSAVQLCELYGLWRGEPISMSMWRSRNEVTGGHR